MLVVGVVMILISFALNTYDRELVGVISSSYSHGIMMDVVSDRIMHIISGGVVEGFPRYIIYLAFIPGAIFLYIGLFSIINKKNPLALFSLSYWKSFQRNFSYKEERRKKIIFIKKRKK